MVQEELEESQVKYLITLVTLLFAAPVFGQTATPCTDGSTWPNGKCSILCNHAQIVAGASECDPIKLGGPMNTIAIELQTNTGCTAGTVAVFSHSRNDAVHGKTTSPWHHIGTIDLSAGADETVLTSMILINGDAAAPMRFIRAEVTGDADCEDPTDIVIHQK